MRSLSAEVKILLVVAALLVTAIVAFIWYASHEVRLRRAESAAITGGDPDRGEAMFIQYGCGSCHAVTNVRTAVGNVGPPLDGIATRVIVAGHLANNPSNMEHWIRDPQQVSPGTAMPDLNVGERDARDITAFLYTRR